MKAISVIALILFITATVKADDPICKRKDSFCLDVKKGSIVTNGANRVGEKKPPSDYDVSLTVTPINGASGQSHDYEWSFFIKKKGERSVYVFTNFTTIKGTVSIELISFDPAHFMEAILHFTSSDVRKEDEETYLHLMISNQTHVDENVLKDAWHVVLIVHQYFEDFLKLETSESVILRVEVFRANYDKTKVKFTETLTRKRLFDQDKGNAGTGNAAKSHTTGIVGAIVIAIAAIVVIAPLNIEM